MEDQLVVLTDPWQDKYDRLLEAHDRFQKLNHTLEDKLLKLAEKHNAESGKLSHQIQDLTQRLVEARLYIHQLEDENERYRNDINVVVKLLQCKPSNFISPKIDTLPEDLQKKVLSQKNGSERKQKKIIKVQVPTSPRTDIVYAVDKDKGKGGRKACSENDTVSAAILAKILQERELERNERKRLLCRCASSKIVLPTVNQECQTMPTCTISYSNFSYSQFEQELHERKRHQQPNRNSRQETQLNGIAPGLLLACAPSKSSSLQLTSDDIDNECSTTSVFWKDNDINGNDDSATNTHHRWYNSPNLYDELLIQNDSERALLPTPIFRRSTDFPVTDSSSQMMKEAIDVVGSRLGKIETSIDDLPEEEGKNCIKEEEESESPSSSGKKDNEACSLQTPSSSSYCYKETSISSSPISDISPTFSSDIRSTNNGNNKLVDGCCNSIPSPGSVEGGRYSVLELIDSRNSVSSRGSKISGSGGICRNGYSLVPTERHGRGGIPHSVSWHTTVLVQAPPTSMSKSYSSFISETEEEHDSGYKGGSYADQDEDGEDGCSDMSPLLKNLGDFKPNQGFKSGVIIDRRMSHGNRSSHYRQQEEEPLLHGYHNNVYRSPVKRSPINLTPGGRAVQHYYRAQKRTFWNRSSSSTSTETEI